VNGTEQEDQQKLRSKVMKGAQEEESMTELGELR